MYLSIYFTNPNRHRSAGNCKEKQFRDSNTKPARVGTSIFKHLHKLDIPLKIYKNAKPKNRGKNKGWLVCKNQDCDQSTLCHIGRLSPSNP